MHRVLRKLYVCVCVFFFWKTVLFLKLTATAPIPLAFLPAAAPDEFFSGDERWQLQASVHAALFWLFLFLFFSTVHFSSARLKGTGATQAYDSDESNRPLSPMNAAVRLTFLGWLLTFGCDPRRFGPQISLSMSWRWQKGEFELIRSPIRLQLMLFSVFW